MNTILAFFCYADSLVGGIPEKGKETDRAPNIFWTALGRIK